MDFETNERKIELENFMKENNIDSNNYNEAIILSIENNVPVALLQQILSKKTDKNLNLEIAYEDNNYVPLFFAIQKNNFELADLLIENGASINYIFEDQNIITYLIKNNFCNNINLNYILNKGFSSDNITSDFILSLLENEKTEFLEIILRFIKFDNNFILNLLNIYKNKNILTDKELCNIIKKEKGKVIITDVMYEKAIEKDNNDSLRVLFENDSNNNDSLRVLFENDSNNNDLLRVLFENDSNKDNIILKRIVKYNLLEKAIKSNCYGFVEKVLCFVTFNNKCMDYEDIFQEAIQKCDIKISKLLINTFIKDSLKDLNNTSGEISNEKYISKLINLVLNVIIKYNNLPLVKYVMESKIYKNNIDINIKDINDEYPIITAFDNGNKEIFKYLLEQGANCNTKNDCDVPLLLLAIHNNKWEMLEQLIEHHVDINEKDINGISPLLKAINQNRTEIVELLIDYANENQIPIDINKKDDYGYYPLIKAINQNNFDIVFSIINYGYENKIDMNVKDINGNTPLTLSYKLNRLDIFKYLVKFLDVNQTDSEGKSVLFYAINRKDAENVKKLINVGANINLKDNSNNSIIDNAINVGNVEIINLLLQKNNIALNIVNSNEETPTISVLLSNKLTGTEKKEIIDKFIEKGSNINMVDSNGNSPIMYAIQKNHLSTVDLLINNGGDINIKNKKDETALNIALNMKNKPIINYLYDKGYNVYNTENNEITFEMMKQIMADNNKELLERLIKNNKFNINSKESDTGNTLLHIAVENRNIDIVRFLVNNGADKNIENNDLCTPRGINSNYYYSDRYIYNDILNMLNY